MQLEGSCHCGSVRFRLRSSHPEPYQLCYCSICRKTQGGGGFAINLSGDNRTLEVEGREHIRVYRAILRDDSGGETHRSSGERNFCGLCGSGLWLYDPSWPDLVHPFASAIDTELPAPPERTHIMLAYRRAWVVDCVADGDRTHDEYPEESIAQWHERVGRAAGD